MSYESTGGSLKLKGVLDKGIKKKKKSKQANKEVVANALRPELYDSSSNSSDKVKQQLSEDTYKEKLVKDPLSNTVVVQKPLKTKAEMAFERFNQKRTEEKVLRRAEKSHKEHVEVYNNHLDSLTEYNDIPKVSWTK